MPARILLTTLFAVCLTTLSLTDAKAQRGVKIGLLECFVDGGSGFILGSTKDVSCTYRSAVDDTVENYFGVLNKIGLDIGYTKEAIMQWAIFAPTNNVYEPGALAGNYVGASASASFAVGLGANVLVGGLRDSFALQPLSVQAQTGINLALGVAELQLRAIE